MALNFGDSKNASKVLKMQQKMVEESNATISKSLPLDVIVENEDNELVYDMDKLDELVETIEEDGFTDPIGVYDLKNGKYEIFSGHKRYRAMKKKGAKTIPANIFPMPKDDIERARRLIKSNSLNREYSPLTQAKELKYYYDNVIVPENKPGKKRAQLAKEFGMSEGQVAKLLALLNLIPELQNLANHPELAFSAFSPAAQLAEDEQKKLYEIVSGTKNEDGTFSITRTEINRYIKQLQGKFEESSNEQETQETSSDAEKNTRIIVETEEKSSENKTTYSMENAEKNSDSKDVNTQEENVIGEKSGIIENTSSKAEEKDLCNHSNASANIVFNPPIAKLDVDFILKTELQNMKQLDIKNMRVVDKERVKNYIAVFKNILNEIENIL